MESVLNAMDLTMTATPKQAMHSVITVTAWSENTTIYYDHWENGYNFDPNNPAATADETYTLATAGAQRIFESTSIPTNPRGTTTYYDGSDHIYVAGGPVTVVRASWIQATGVENQAVAWEIYPVQPQLTTYVIPFGEDLGASLPDFSRVFVFVQATENNTVVTFDFNGDGTKDTFCTDITRTACTPGTQITLSKGQSFLLDNWALSPQAAPYNKVHTGMVITGTETLQVKFVAGQERTPTGWMARGFSAFPRGFWTKDYYAPVDNELVNTDYYLYNPNTAAITVTWETRTTTGSLSIPAGQTVSYRTLAGDVPTGSGIYFKGSDVFWGVGSVDAGNYYYEWGFSLLPSTMMYNEHYLGWAPDCLPVAAGCTNNGVFLVPAQDYTTIFVDVDNNGTVDQTYTLNRLQTQYITAPSGNLSMAHIWATGPFSMAYGQKGNTTYPQVPAMDLGYVSLPATDFISAVLTVQKSASPQVVPTASGSVATFTITASSQKYTVDNITVTDTLPPNWQYVTGSTTITRPDKTTGTANPTVTGAGTAANPYVLTWSSADLGTSGTIAENQEVKIVFNAQTTAVLASGTLNQNRVKAIGTRTFGTPSQTQTFTATDFAYVTSGFSQITKTSGAADPVFPGNTIPYTVTVSNPASATSSLTGVSIYDPLPSGVSYVAGSAAATCILPRNVADFFGSTNYNNSNGSVSWAANSWTESDSYGTGPGVTGLNGLGGYVWITGGQLQFRYMLSTVSDNFATNGSYTGTDGSRKWIGIGPGTVSVTNGSPAVVGTGTTFTGGLIGTGDSITILGVTYTILSVTDATHLTLTTNYAGTTGTGLAYIAPVAWTEVNDDGSAATVANQHMYVSGNRLVFDRNPSAVTPFSISRSANVAGATSVTISFLPTNRAGGAGSGEAVVADYSVDGGGYTTLGTFDGGTAGWSGITQTYTLSPFTGNFITLRFRATGAWNNNNDEIYIDNVNISFNAPASAVNTQIRRTASLTGATSAWLNFSPYSSTGLGAGDTLVVEASSSGTAGTFVTLATFTGGVPDVAPAYNLTPYISATTTIQFRVTGGFNTAGQTFNLDNLSIGYIVTPATTATVGSPPNFVDSASACSSIPAGGSLTLTYSVTVDDPFPTGQTSITNIASTTSAQIPMALTASATNTVLIPSALSAGTGGKIWLDADRDGVLDIGEPGIPNIEVTLKDRFGTPIATTITDGNGRYLFTGVTPGTGYYVEVTDGLSSGLSQSFPYTTTPGDLTNNRSTTFTLTDGQIYTSAGIGYRAAAGTATFGDQVWVDANANGVRDSGEIGLGGVTVKLYQDRNSDDRLDILTDLPDGVGTVSATNSSTAVVGSGTAFSALNAGDAITIAGVAYTIQSVTDATHLTLTANYTGTTGGGKAYTMPVATVSNPDGTYLFTGAAASGTQTYFVSAATPSGYTATTGSTNHRFTNVAAGSTLLIADFGFNRTTTTYSIKDRVWTDSNGDGLFSGESGLAGVTVELHDASLNVIGTTITAADGTFIFSGLTGGGADYTVRINDTSGVLLDYYGTTSYSLALKRPESNLTTSIDRVATPPPSFGFRPLRSIGDTIFSDLLGGTSGVQDAGEPGIAGVVVSLYRNIAPLGTFDGSDTLISTVTTDASGQYLFSGLADGEYIVSVPVPAGYSFIPNGVVNPDLDGNPANGIQNRVTITGGVSDLNKDFGFQASSPRTVSGTVWDDLDADGVIDGGEAGLAGVTIDILSGSTVVATVTTNASGNYTAPGLASGIYTVRVTDTTSVLTDYISTFEKTESTTGPFNFQESVNLTGGDVADVIFGFKVPTPTLVTLSDFSAYSDKGRFVVQWKTSSETDTAGFYLQRLDEKTGRYRQINSSLLPALITSPQGGTYSLIDNGASLTRSNTYLLMEIEGKGRKNAYGPFTIAAGAGNAAESQQSRKAGWEREGEMAITDGSTGNTAADEVSDYTRAGKAIPAEKQKVLDAMKKARAASDLLQKQKTGNMVKIPVHKDGLYYLESAEISSLLGMAETKVRQLIKSGNLALSNQGNIVAYIPADDMAGLFFFGQGIDSLYTKENIYWLYKGKGQQMGRVEGVGPAPSGYSAVTETVHIEEDKVAAPVLAHGPESDYWFWDYIIGGNPSLGTKRFELQVFGVADVSTSAALSVRLHGLTSTGAANDHHVTISLNGTVIGEDRWKGAEERLVNLNFSQSLLHGGANSIEVKGLLDAGVPYSIFYLDSFDLTYEKVLEAHDNSLMFRAEGALPLTVYGFTQPDLFVLDVTDPDWPIFNMAATIDGSDGNYHLSFTPTPGARYLVTASDAAAPVNAWADSPSTLLSRHNRADYIIITTKELAAAAGELAHYREAQGLKTLVADLEDIMDEFNYGISNPEAIHGFLAYAYTNWKQAPKYVLLAGHGTYDYRDNMGIGDNLVPTLMAETPQVISASDNLFADMDGDHVPDIAIGRLPVLTAEELRGVIGKIISYESNAGSRVIMLADNPDDGGNFPADSDQIAALVPAAYPVSRIYLSAYTTAQARQLLFDEISRGPVLLNYTGHAGMDRLASEGLLRVSDVASLQNSRKPFVLAGMTCAVGNFALAGYNSLGEALMTKNPGGAVAVWAPSGLSYNHLSKILNEHFFRGSFGNGSVTLGDAVLRAFRNYHTTGSPVYIMDMFNLQGDPALRIW
ncbi:MAG: DUF11 domain-containing protein [Nitrospirae bacterium]|nr:DUF11 domain-containing protein [Nitrospirota bacterium]